MQPRFHIGEIVRVARVSDEWMPTFGWMLGREVSVERYAGANDNGDGWLLWVRIPPLGRPEDRPPPFDESDLEPTGLQIPEDALEDRGGKHGPEPVDPDPPEEMGDELYMYLSVGVEEEQAEDLMRVVGERLRDRVASGTPAKVTRMRVSVRTVERGHYHLHFFVSTNGRLLAAFDALAASVDEGWGRRTDDGWHCEARWHKADAPNAVFLAPEIEVAHVEAYPWDSPQRRPLSERRPECEAPDEDD